MKTDTKLLIEEGQVQLLRLTDSNVTLVCRKLIRYLPGKRWVCFAHWGEQEVIVKLFAKQCHAQHELEGALALAEANMQTPALLQHGWVEDKPLYAVIYEYIPFKKNLDEIWLQANNAQRIELIERLITIIAQLHIAGLQQHDIHPQNFLFHDDKFYVLDAGQVTQTKNQQMLSKRLSLRNLAALLAQFPPYYDAYAEQFYLFYSKASSSVFTVTDIARLKKWIRCARKNRLIKFGKKAFRTSTPFICEKNWWYFQVINRDCDTPALRELLKNFDQVLQAPTTTILKMGNSSTVGKVFIDGKFLVIKRYNLKNIWHVIKRAFRSRAAKNWRNAHYLSLLNVATAKPLAMLEKRFGTIRRVSYSINEYVDAEDLKTIFSKINTSEQLELITNNLKQMFAALDNVQLVHGDMKATNILLNNNLPVLLDLDAMYLYRTYWRWQRAARGDKQRFMRNWEEQPEIQRYFKDDA